MFEARAGAARQLTGAQSTRPIGQEDRRLPLAPPLLRLTGPKIEQLTRGSHAHASPAQAHASPVRDPDVGSAQRNAGAAPQCPSPGRMSIQRTNPVNASMQPAEVSRGVLRHTVCSSPTAWAIRCAATSLG